MARACGRCRRGRIAVDDNGDPRTADGVLLCRRCYQEAEGRAEAPEE